MPVIRFTTQMAREDIGPMGIYWASENILDQWKYIGPAKV